MHAHFGLQWAQAQNMHDRTETVSGHHNTKLGQTKVQSGKKSTACNNNHVHIYNIAPPWSIGTKHHYVNNENKYQDANSAYPKEMKCKSHLHHGAS